MWRPLKADALGGLKRYWADVVIICCLVAISLWVRRLTLMDIEAGGDAVKKWFFVKQWSYDRALEDVEWNHHLTRMGINLWVYFAQKLWGTGPAVYYVVPVAAATAGVVFTYKLAQELGGRYAGVIAALWFTTLEPMERAGSQLLPAAFEAAYVAGAAYFLLWYLRYQGPTRRRRILLGMIVVFLFFAYLAKESSLLFFPGFVLALWFWGNDRRDVLILVGALLGLFLLETAWYLIFTDYSGRFDIVTHSHKGGTLKGVTHSVRSTGGGGGGGGSRQAAEKVVDTMALFWRLLQRYEVLWESIKFPLYLFLGASLALSVFGGQRPAKAITLLVFVQLFLTTIALRKLKPLTIWMSNEPRYMIVLCPLLVAMNSALMVELLRRARRILHPRVKKWFRFLSGRFAPALAVAATVVLSLVVAKHYHAAFGERTLRTGFPLERVRNLEARFSDAFDRGLPIVEKRSRDDKALRIIWSVFLKEDLIARAGHLPSFEKAVQRLDNRYDWLSKDAAAHGADARNKVQRERKCAYVSQIRGRYLQQTPAGSLPRACVARAR